MKVLSQMAKESSSWLIGGMAKSCPKNLAQAYPSRCLGSIPERVVSEDSDEDDRIYNTTTVYSPKGKVCNVGLVWSFLI